MKALIGTYWKTREGARKDAENKTKRRGVRYVTLKFGNKFIVVSEKQAERLK